ncbi:MAG: hypothetical protein Q8N98_01100, partial [bacterium]|nr:hypothetical protein [bacterium]
ITATGRTLPPTPPLNSIVEYSIVYKGYETDKEPFNNGSLTVPIESSNHKIKYGEAKNVLLYMEEHNKLISHFGEQGANEKINSLSYYIGSKGDKYKSHYLTILNWDTLDKKKAGEHYGTSKGHFAASIPTVYTDPETLFGKPTPPGESPPEKESN